MSTAVRVGKSKIEKWCSSKGDTLLLKELPGRSCQWDQSEGWWWRTGRPWHIHPGHAWPLSGPTILTPHRTAGKNSPHERTIRDWGDGKRHRQLWGFSLPLISPSAWGKGKEIKVQMTQQRFQAKQLLSEPLSVRPRNHELRVESRPLPLEWEVQLCPPPQEKKKWPEEESWLLTELMQNTCSAVSVTLRLSRKNPWRRHSVDEGWGAPLTWDTPQVLNYTLPHTQHTHT